MVLMATVEALLVMYHQAPMVRNRYQLVTGRSSTWVPMGHSRCKAQRTRILPVTLGHLRYALRGMVMRYIYTGLCAVRLYLHAFSITCGL